jgi:hypothetical protein
LRGLIALVIAALIGSAVFALAPPGGSEPARMALLAVEVVGVGFAIYVWGALSAWTWIVAALADRGLTELRLAAHAPTAQERLAGALALFAICALIGLVGRRTWRAAHHDVAPQSG